MEWLIGEGRAYLERYQPPHQHPSGLTVWQRSMLVGQWELRQRSRRRFPDPSRWLWTERSLAQASDWWSAVYKASHFPAGAPIVDACCGAGVDSAALLTRASVTAIDLDENMCALTQSNTTACASARTTGHSLKVRNVAFDEVFAKQLSSEATHLHIDPDRRAPSLSGQSPSLDNRTCDADLFSPPLEVVLRCTQLFNGAMIKLAPSTRMSGSLQSEIDQLGSRIWIGNMGECRQQLLLTGTLAFDGQRQRSAVLAEPNASTPETYVGNVREFATCLTQPATFVFDLHPVLHAADLQLSWADQHNLQPLGSEHGYFTGTSPIHGPWVQCFQMIEELPWDDRKVRKWLRSREVGVVEIKNRLVKLNAGEFQRKYSGKGAEHYSLLVTRLGDRVRALACRRMTVEPP
ncbi:MAG: methyltransferase domain-containing protein [Pirellulaceae bacterium]